MVTGNITAKDAIFIILSSFISTTRCHTLKTNYQKFAWPFNHTFFVRRAWGKLCLAWFPLYHWVEAQETMAPLLLALQVEWPRCWPCRQNDPGAWAWLWNRVWVTRWGFGAVTYIGQPADATGGPVGGLH